MVVPADISSLRRIRQGNSVTIHVVGHVLSFKKQVVKQHDHFLFTQNKYRVTDNATKQRSYTSSCMEWLTCMLELLRYL